MFAFDQFTRGTVFKQYFEYFPLEMMANKMGWFSISRPNAIQSQETKVEHSHTSF